MQAQAELPESTAVLWYFDNRRKLSMVRVRTGVTDGRNTELIDGHDIKEGMEFISGIAKQGAAANNSDTRQDQRTRGPRPPRLF